MRRVQEAGTWSLFCPSKCPDLIDLHSEPFDCRYEWYEQNGYAASTIKAQDLWFAILDSQVETGTPYMLYKDSCNAKSNHKHLGTIRSSNLCTEVVQFSTTDETAVCNLASIALPRFVNEAQFDWDRLRRVVNVVTRNLNRVIDRNAYPNEAARRSNMRHRPIGIGVQGLADVFALMHVAFDSERAREINRRVFECIYHSSLDASCELAETHGPYDSFQGSPVSTGQLQYDMWDVTPPEDSLWNWSELKRRVAKHGLRNSLLVAPMPTASTAQILGNNECFEPFTSNVFVRRVLAGEYMLVNKHLVARLQSLGLWDEEMRQSLLAANGSVQHIDSIPDDVKAVYKTVWEISMRTLIDMAADRAPFVDQSQSLNLFVADPTHAKLTSMHFYAWQKGLKTGMYYLRTKPAAEAVQVALPVCRRDNPDCVACSA